VRPNVLLVVFDTARADAFDPYGAPPGSTPVVADLARRGAAAPAAYATANWTLPSHASLFAGRLPRALGLGRGTDPREVLAGHADRLLPEVLRRAGYRTGAVSANVWVSRRHGFAVGFERFRQVTGPRRHHAGRGLLGRLRWSAQAVMARVDDGLRAVEGILLRWIAELDAPAPDGGSPRPFFWFANLMECHSPYLPPRPYNDLGPIGRFLAGEDARRYQSHAGFVRVSLGELDVPAQAERRMRRLYYRAVRSMDDWLGRILEALDARRALDDTLVVVTSDHGENLGEGHLLGHTLSLDDRLIRVPLVVCGPGAPSFPATPVSLAAVPRLVARAVGLDEHPWQADPVPPGVAVAQTDGFRSVSLAFAEAFARSVRLPERAVRAMSARRSCATDGRFKLVRVEGAERLHDLAADPLELADAQAAHPEAAARLRAVLDRAEEEAEEEAPVAARSAEAGSAGAGPAGAGPAGGRVPGGEAGPAEPPGEEADLEERLRLLGYL
jgi:arylsulfatase A-like enzyme